MQASGYGGRKEGHQTKFITDWLNRENEDCEECK